ncbi:MAG: hypothetical protein U0R19_07570 [Bryobacteraceae bacterium]
MLPTAKLRTRFALLLVAAALAAQPGAKRPIQPEDFDSWKSIANQKLSDDGKFLAYTVTPQVGNGELVLRNLETGAERKESIGSRPSSTTDNTESEPGAEPSPGPPGRPTAPRGNTLAFTADGKYVIFTANPTKEDADKARRARNTEAPKPSLVILPTSGGEAIRIAGVRNFQLAANDPRWLAYQLEPPPPPARPASETKQERPGTATRPTTASDVILRDLTTQAERKFVEVSEYSLSKDGKTLVYAVSSKNEDNNGIHAAQTDGSESKSVLSGKGRYSRLTWDEAQQRLAFLSTRDDAAARTPAYSLYLWNRTAGSAELAVNKDTPGMRSGWRIGERGAINFSKDGSRLFFATAPAPAPRRTATAAPSEDKAVADLWHWKDPIVQSMQKVRAEQDRNRTYRAVYCLRKNGPCSSPMLPCRTSRRMTTARQPSVPTIASIAAWWNSTNVTATTTWSTSIAAPALSLPANCEAVLRLRPTPNMACPSMARIGGPSNLPRLGAAISPVLLVLPFTTRNTIPPARRVPMAWRVGPRTARASSSMIVTISG